MATDIELARVWAVNLRAYDLPDMTEAVELASLLDRLGEGEKEWRVVEDSEGLSVFETIHEKSARDYCAVRGNAHLESRRAAGPWEPVKEAEAATGISRML